MSDCFYFGLVDIDITFSESSSRLTNDGFEDNYSSAFSSMFVYFYFYFLGNIMLALMKLFVFLFIGAGIKTFLGFYYFDYFRPKTVLLVFISFLSTFLFPTVLI